jgi:hypothetical protein
MLWLALPVVALTKALRRSFSEEGLLQRYNLLSNKTLEKNYIIFRCHTVNAFNLEKAVKR